MIGREEFSPLIRIYNGGVILMNKLFAGIKNEISSFLTEVSKANETIYLVLLTLYVAIYLELKIVFFGKLGYFVEKFRYAVLGIVMWGSALYLYFIIITWKNLWNKNFWLILIGLMLLGTVGYFSTKMSTNAYGVVFDLVFCVLACGKSYRKILNCILGATVAALVIAGVGLPLKFTVDLGKPDRYVPGHSLGINYPNTWGYIAFLVLILLWYLYLRNKPYITFPIFWACAAFNWYYITCRTIAAFTFLFPFLALIIDLIESRIDKKVAEGTYKRKRVIDWILISIPFIAFAFMMILSMNYEWMHQFYQGSTKNVAWRFLQGGLYFKTYGLPIFGNPYHSNVHTFQNVNGEFIEVGILDSSFAAYIIMRGMVWLAYTLLWLCLAHWKAIKKRDYAIILLETMILGFAMMERPGLELWYNFILAYPLARVVSKPMTDKVLEFDLPQQALPADNPEAAQAEVPEELPETPIMVTDGISSDLPADISPDMPADVPTDVSSDASVTTEEEV